MSDAQQTVSNIPARVEAMFQVAGIPYVNVLPWHQNDQHWIVTLPGHPDTATLDKIIATGLKIFEPGENSVVIQVPMEWVRESQPSMEVPTISVDEDEAQDAAEFAALTEAQLAQIWITAELTQAGFDMSGAIISPPGKNNKPLRYCVTMPRGGLMALSAAAIEEQTRFTYAFIDGRKLTLDLPVDWNGQETEAVEPELSETARLIKELQDRLAAKDRIIDELTQQQMESLNELRYAHLPTERVFEASMNHCVKIEFMSFNTNQGEKVTELANRLNTGWRVAYERIEDNGKYFARLECDADAEPLHAPARTERKLATVVQGSRIYPTPTPFPMPVGERMEFYQDLMQNPDLTSQEKREIMNARLMQVGAEAYQEASAAYIPPANPFKRG